MLPKNLKALNPYYTTKYFKVFLPLCKEGISVLIRIFKNEKRDSLEVNKINQ